MGEDLGHRISPDITGESHPGHSCVIWGTENRDLGAEKSGPRGPITGGGPAIKLVGVGSPGPQE